MRQGCGLSPSLFNLYTEMIFRYIVGEDGVIIGGESNNDDTALFSELEWQLQRIVEAVNEKRIDFGIKMNVKKTKTMIINRKNKFQQSRYGYKIKTGKEQSFIYLGHLISEDDNCEKMIKRRIEIVRGVFNNMRKTLMSREISLKTRTRLIKCYVWSTLLYGMEAWTINKTMEKRL